MARFRNTSISSRVVHHVELPALSTRRRKGTLEGSRSEDGPPLKLKLIPAAPAQGERKALREVLIPALDPGSGLYKQQVGVLERRMAKLNLVIQEQQALLARLESGGAEVGLASEFRAIQGLNLGESGLEHKQEMMRTIFEANLELRDSIVS